MGADNDFELELVQLLNASLERIKSEWAKELCSNAAYLFIVVIMEEAKGLVRSGMTKREKEAWVADLLRRLRRSH